MSSVLSDADLDEMIRLRYTRDARVAPQVSKLARQFTRARPSRRIQRSRWKDHENRPDEGQADGLEAEFSPPNDSKHSASEAEALRLAQTFGHIG